MDIDLIYAGRFTYAQTAVQITHAWFLALVVSGQIYNRVYTVNGKKYLESGNLSIWLIPPNFKIDFSYSAERENIVVICNIPGLHYDESADRLLLRTGSGEIALNRHLQLTKERTLHFRSIFERIIYLHQSRLPANVFASEQLTGAMLGELAQQEIDTPMEKRIHPDLADRLKQKLDEDREVRITLRDHCRSLGYCPEYARRCFFLKFCIDPQEYRLRRRLEYIIQLINLHCYSTKEIADLAGMKSVNHLHSFIRQRCGMTPRELAKKIPN